MASDTLDTYIKSPAPPKDPDSQYIYNEQQFGNLEKALKKHQVKIIDTKDYATSLYEQEVIARSTEDAALVQTIETLKANITAADLTTQAQIQNVQTAQADLNSSTATKLTQLEAKVDLGDTNNIASIKNEQKVRSDQTSALASSVSNLSAAVKVADSTTKALIREESTVRATVTDAIASRVSTLAATVGDSTAGLVHDQQVTASSLSATASDVTTLKSSVTNNTSSITTLTSTTANISGALSASWAIQGNLNGATGGLTLTGVKKADGTGATYSLVIDANTTINGSLVVSGTITGSKIVTNGTTGVDTANINGNAVSNTSASQGAGSASVSITLRAGARVSILATYAGNRSNGTTGGSNTLKAQVDGADFTNNATSIYSVALVTAASSIAYISYNYVVTGLVTNYASTPATLLTTYTVPNDGRAARAYTVSANSGGWNETVSILVMELAR